MTMMKAYCHLACLVALSVVGLVGLLANQALAATEYFDVNGATAGSGVTASGYSWDDANWSVDSTGASATTNWMTEGDFPFFAAGTDAGTSIYTVTANSNHTIAGMQLGASGGGTVNVNTAGGAVLSIASGQKDFFVALGENLFINGVLDGVDSTSGVIWQNGGGGSLFLYGANTFAGGVQLNTSQGLNFNNASSFGTGPITFGTGVTSYVLANPATTAPVTISNLVIGRSGTNTTLTYTGHDATTFSSLWTLGSTATNTFTVGNSTFTTAKLILSGGVAGASDSNLTVNSGTNVTGTLVLSGTSTYGGITSIGGTGTGTPILQADEGVGLPSNSFLVLNGGVLQTSGNFTRSLALNGGANQMEWNTNGGGFSAIGSQLTVNMGNANAELLWGTTVGSQIVGTLKFGSGSANAKTLFVNPLDLDNTGSAATRTINVTAGAGGDSAEMNAILRNSSGAASVTKTGTGTLILSAANTYTGVTTISGGILSATTLADGGAASSIGQSGNGAANLVLGGGTLQYTGGTQSTNRRFTLGTGTTAGTIDASGSGALTFSNTNSMAFSGSGTRTLILSGTNTGDNTMTAIIGDSGGATSLTKSGAGRWVLPGANTYTGTTTVSAGTLALGNTGSLPSTGALTLSGGTLSNISGAGITLSNATTLSATSTVTTPSAAQTFTFSGSFTNSGGNRTLTGGNATAGSASGLITLSGSIFLSNSATTGRTLTLAGASSSNPVFLVSGNIANFNGSGLAGGITIGGTTAATAVTATLSGTNTHTGNTTLNTTSLLKIGSAGAFGSSTFVIGGNGSFDNTTGGALVLTTNMNQSGGSPIFIGTDDLTLGNVALSAANRSITVSAKTLTVNNVTEDATPRNYTKNGNGTLLIKGNATYTGTTTVSGGILQIGDGGTTGALSTSSAIVDNANLTFNRSDSITQGTHFSGSAITGTGSLTKAGSGTTTLSAANAYSGGTTVSNGLLTLSGAVATLGTGNVTVQQGTAPLTGLVIQTGVTNAIADSATLNLLGGGTVGDADQGYADLGAGINERVGSLQLNSVAQANGVTYGSTGSTALIQSNEYFTGSGVVSVGLLGDFNGDGSVNAADYVVWRMNPNTFGGTPAGYDLWRANFGNTVSGAGSGAVNGGAVPEPSSICLLMLSIAALAGRHSRLAGSGVTLPQFNEKQCA